MRGPAALVVVLVGVALVASAAPATAQPTSPPAAKASPTVRQAPRSVGAPAAAPARVAARAAVGARPGAKATHKGRRPIRRPIVVDAPGRPRGPAGPPGSFEALLGSAQDQGSLARTLEPFTELCNERRDMTRRQCQVVRAYLRTVLHRRVFRSDVEPGALVVGPYVQKQGGRTVTLQGCLACKKAVPGDRPHLVTVRPPAKLTPQGPKGFEVASTKVAHPSSHVGELWMRDVGSKLRAELIYKFGPEWTRRSPRGRTARGTPSARRPGWDDGSGEVRGLALNLLGYRVYDRCSGEVLMASPKAAFKAVVAPNQPDCPKPEVKVAASQPGVRQPDPSWSYVLSVGEIRRSMDAVRGQVRACYLQFQIPGAAELEIDIGGMDGNVLGVKVLGKFEDTPTGDCITSALGGARFPNFRAASMKVPYNFYLQ